LNFTDVIYLRDTLAGAFSDVIQGAPQSNRVLQEVLHRNYASIPTKQPYRVYAFMNHDEEPSLEVVAAECDLSLEEEG
jgi:hypothetical protein